MKPRKLSKQSFSIINREPNIISLTRTQLKADSAKIEEELLPIESEIEMLNRMQEELKDQIMSSRVIERQMALKSFEALETAQMNMVDNKENIENIENFDQNIDAIEKLKNLRRALSLLEDEETKNSEEYKGNEGKIISLRDMEKMLIRRTPHFEKEDGKRLEEEDLEINDLLDDFDLKKTIENERRNQQNFKQSVFDETIKKTNPNIFKKKKQEIVENFQKKLTLKKPEEENFRNTNMEQGKNYNKEKIDQLSDEIQELLEIQNRKTEKKIGPFWGNLSEIKEASLEESVNEA